MANQQSQEFRFSKVMLRVPERNAELDITASTLELHIHESVRVPYLTARMLIADTETVIEAMKLTGTEIVTIELTNDDYNFTYSRDFYVTRTDAHIQLGDNMGKGYLFYLTEDIFVLDVLKTISRGFRGTPVQIINKVMQGEFNRVLKTVGKLPRESAFTYVSPYISPLEIVETIRQRSTDTTGFPYFCYATIKDRDIIMKSLSTMLENPPLNQVDFVYGASQANSGQEGKINNIESLSQLDNNDTLEMVLKGAVQSQYNVLNMSTAQVNARPDVNIPKILNDDNNSIYNKDFEIDGKKIEQYNPRVLYKIVNHTNQDELGLNDEADIENHTNRAKAHGLRSALSKHILEISLNGLIGWSAQESFVGNQISISIPSTATQEVEPTQSGTYVVLQTKHSFIDNKYEQFLTCSKLSHTREKVVKTGPSGFISL